MLLLPWLPVLASTPALMQVLTLVASVVTELLALLVTELLALLVTELLAKPELLALLVTELLAKPATLVPCMELTVSTTPLLSEASVVLPWARV